ncbi:MAG TPA: hypothetical protein VK212_01120 [Lentimicrobium sp.]|nr:hypothetical protein [Lentimicrobium sp.]
MMDKIITVNDKNRGLFLATREDYMDKIERLARLITEKYPEISDTIDVTELHALYRTGSLHELVDYYEKIYHKVKELNIPSYRPYWMFRTKFYS